MMFEALRKYIWKVRQLPKGEYNLIAVTRNYFLWKSLLKPGRSPLSDGLPWMTLDAIHFIQKAMNRKMKVFEYGMGGSTIFFSKLAAEVVSIEHDRDWFESANKYILEKGIQNCQPHLVEPEISSELVSFDPADPSAYCTGDKSLAKFRFRNYVRAIENYPDAYFDLVVVDGRSRPSCLKHTVKKLKPGGYILLDNSDRSHYKRAIDECITIGFKEVLNTVGPTAYSEDFTRTLIRRKN